MVSTLVSSVWLRQQITNGLRHIRILDATMADNARQEYMKDRIEGAMFFDIQEISNQTSVYPDMLPTSEEFTNYVRQLGVNGDSHVVVYDNNKQYGLFSAPRAWWMFRVFGHRNVSVLDGGLPRWKFRGFPTQTCKPGDVICGDFKATLNPDLVRTFEQMKEIISTNSCQVVDARSEGRFHGTAPEPKEGLHSGHMTGAINVPYMSLLNPDTKILKSKHEILEVFEAAGVNLDHSMVATCGSGITAAVIAMATHIATNNDIPVYDGSWTEWVQRADSSTIV